MKLYSKNIIAAFCLLAVTNISSRAQNEPTDIFQPTGPFGGGPTYTFHNYNHLNYTASIFNYDRVYVPRQAMMTIDGTTMGKTYRTTTYYNGWGNALQTVFKTGTGGKDVITPMYQKPGFNNFAFRPYAATTATVNPTFHADPMNAQISYFNTTTTHAAEQGYSYSLNKISLANNIIYNEQYDAGLSFVGSSRAAINHSRFNNSSDGNITKWSVGSNGLPQNDGVYSMGELKVNVSQAEHGRLALEYLDKDGKLLVKKAFTGSGYLETWYVYNAMGKLQWVMPPKVLSSFTSFQTVPTADQLNKLCYRIEYDKYGQTIESYVPDKYKNANDNWGDFIVYDKWHRPILYQSPLLRASGQWKFNVYDINGRICFTGIYTDPDNLSRAAMQSLVDAGTSSTPPPLFAYIWNGYTGGTYPTSITNCVLHEYIYYDRYDQLPSPMSGRTPYNYASTEFMSGLAILPVNMKLGFARGQVTGRKTKVLDPSNNNVWVHQVFFYDVDGRLTQTQTLNPWNTSNQWDMNTTQYNFSNNAVININEHFSWTGTNKATTKVTTKYNYNYNNGQLMSVDQKADNAGWRDISTYYYDELGRVESKNLGAAETQKYKYNIRGQLESINADHVYNHNITSYKKTFGEIICYDYGFDNKRYDGSIAGYIWRGSGYMDCARAYGYDYDRLGRLTKADFNERAHPTVPSTPASIWKNTDVDYSVSDLTYDANGNMGTMKQKGMAHVTSGGSTTLQPVLVDDLSYTYDATSNKLTKVADPATYHVNDFLDGTNTTDDYAYDANGNLTEDKNKGITNITYNYQNLPVTVTKGSDNITNIYDANGNLLQKTINDGSTTTVYRYPGRFVYKDNKLQHYYHQEGRSRWLEDSTKFKDDFFIRDHLNNVRTTVTADVSFGINEYKAGFEIAYANLEETVFDNIGGIREAKPLGTPQDLMSGKLNGGVDSLRIGAAILVKTMTGDNVSLKAFGYYEDDDSAAMNTYSTPEDMMTSLLNTITNGTNGYSSENINIPGLAPGTINALLSPANYNLYEDIKADATDPAYPRAYLNLLVFDENMELQPTLSKVLQLRGVHSTWHELDLGYYEAKANGFILAYLSNESVIDVYVDNEVLMHVKGRLLQEQHYYPHGMLFSKPVATTPAVQNNHLYQTKGLQEELGLELHDFHARQYDAQIGRFWAVDPMNEFPSGYTGMGNDPANLLDPTGMKVQMNAGMAPDVVSHRRWKEALANIGPTPGTPFYMGHGAMGWTSLDYLGTFDEVISGGGGGRGSTNYIDARIVGGGISEYRIRMGKGGSIGYYRGDYGFSYQYTSDMRAEDGVEQYGGNIMNMGAGIGAGWVTIGKFGLSKFCQSCYDPTTVGNNQLGLTYAGGENPKSYSKEDSYEYIPKSMADYPAIGHDRRYDALKIKGPRGLFTDTRAIGADWRFVAEEVGVVLNPASSINEKLQATYLGFGLGLFALPKTIYQLSQPYGGITILSWYHISNYGVTNQPAQHKH